MRCSIRCILFWLSEAREDVRGNIATGDKTKWGCYVCILSRCTTKGCHDRWAERPSYRWRLPLGYLLAWTLPAYLLLSHSSAPRQVDWRSKKKTITETTAHLDLTQLLAILTATRAASLSLLVVHHLHPLLRPTLLLTTLQLLSTWLTHSIRG
jgi:hypothetical protein